MYENQLASTLPLNGRWQIDIGGQTSEIRVPGAWEAQGVSGKAGVTDPVIYRRTVDIPAEWSGAHVDLRFGAVSYYAEVLVNGRPVGTHEGLWTPFEFDVTAALHPGATNHIEVRVVKPGYKGDRFPYRDVLGGFLPYVFDNFGGIWQDVELVASRAPRFFGVEVAPRESTVEVLTRVWAQNQANYRDLTLVASISDSGGQIVAQTRQPADLNNKCALNVESPERWSLELPALYRVILQLEQAGEVVAQTERKFGFRRLHAEGERLLFNDAPVHLRAALGWGWDAKTLAPAPSDEQIREEFRKLRALGFNALKLCLYVPTANVFEIADEEGMFLWLELPLWLPHLTDHLRDQAKREYAAILAMVHHHPSVVIYSLGCELGAEMADAALLDTLNALVRGTTCGALVCDNSGSGEAYKGLNFDYADFNDYHFYCDLHYFVPLLDLFHRDWRPTRPLIFGEFCDCDDYRDPADLLVDGKRPAWRDYMGVEGNLDRWRYSQQEEFMAATDLPFTDARLAAISREQSLVVRKTILERTRARRDGGGYVLTGLRDTPMSTSGVFDDKGHDKYPVAEFRQFNADAVLLLEQGRARRWVHGGDRPYREDLFNHRSGGQASFRIVLAHAQREFEAGDLVWRLTSPQGVMMRHKIALGRTLDDSPCEIARVEFGLPEVQRPTAYQFEVELNGAIKNHWTLWVYPAALALDIPAYDPAGSFEGWRAADLGTDRLVVASAFTPELERYLRAGGKAVVMQNGAGGLPTQAVPFWRESIKLLYDHPVMNTFPHKGYADLQFYHLATDHAFDTAAFGDIQVTPVMRRLDARLFTVLDYVVDVRIGAGRMLATTLRLFGGAGDQVSGLEANVAGEYLLRQMSRALET